MTEKQAFVVMLPLTDEQHFAPRPIIEEIGENDFRFARHCDAAFNSLVTSIGTPVDSSVPVVARTSEFDLNRVKNGKSGDIYSQEEWEGSDVPVFTVPLVRQSDHLAALAEKQAEVERLRAALNAISVARLLEPEQMAALVMEYQANQALAGAAS